jgi:hypothetical protein
MRFNPKKSLPLRKGQSLHIRRTDQEPPLPGNRLSSGFFSSDLTEEGRTGPTLGLPTGIGGGSEDSINAVPFGEESLATHVLRGGTWHGSSCDENLISRSNLPRYFPTRDSTDETCQSTPGVSISREPHGRFLGPHSTTPGKYRAPRGRFRMTCWSSRRSYIPRVRCIDNGMKAFPSFTEYLARRSAAEPPDPDQGSTPVDERSLMGGIFKAVNPARPVSPMNSRLLSPPIQKRFKSQVIGR